MSYKVPKELDLGSETKRVMTYKINITTILLILIIIVGAKIGWDKYSQLQTDLRIAQQNQSALLDSIRVSKNKLNQEVYSKQIFVAETQKELKKLSSELAKTVKNFNGAIHEISELEAKIDGIAGQIDNDGEVVELPSGQTGITWDFSEKFDENNSRMLKGITKFEYNPNTNVFSNIQTEVLQDKINFKLVQGLRTTEDGDVEMFASSNYPGFTATNLNSVLISPETHPALKKFTKKKKWSLGIHGGYGFTLNTRTNEVIMGPQIGAGATYIIF